MAQTKQAPAAKTATKTPEAPPQEKPVAKRPQKPSIQAPIGCPLQWFSLGRGNEKPWAAQCVGHVGPDMVTLRVTDGVGERIIEACPHMSDPLLSTRPPMPGVDPDGAWDYIHALPGLIPKEHRGIDARAIRVVMLSLRHHWSPGQIANAMKMPEKDVEAILQANAEGTA